MQNRIPSKSEIPEVYVTFERAGIDYKETLSVSLRDRNYSLDELIQKVKQAVQSDTSFSKNKHKEMEYMR